MKDLIISLKNSALLLNLDSEGGDKKKKPKKDLATKKLLRRR